MRMEGESGDLGLLRDIVSPDPVSWWPMAPGWYVLGVLVLGLAGFYGMRALRHHRANRYRREAKRLLESAASNAEVSGVLKRAAMVFADRRIVAGLSGGAWCDWLESVGGRTMTAEEREGFVSGVYDEDRSHAPVILPYALQWVARHKAQEEVSNEEVSA